MNSSVLKLINLITLTGVIFISGCSKNSSNSVSKTQLITSSSWKYSSAGIDLGNGTVSPLPAGTLLTCDTDNTITFKSDQTGIVDEGPTRCTTTLPQTTPFTWSLSNNEADLTFSTAIIAGVSGDAKIIELTSSKFSLSKSVTVPGLPIPVPVIVVLVH